MVVLLLWIIFVIYVSCLSCCHICSFQPYGHLLSILALLYVMFSYGFCHFPIWCPGSLSIPDFAFFLPLTSIPALLRLLAPLYYKKNKNLLTL